MKETNVAHMQEISQHLADAIEARRRELGLGPSELAEAAGVTVQGLAPLRKGVRKQYQDRLTFPICRALGWTPDSISRLLAGGAPVLAAGAGSLDPTELPRVAALEARVAELEAAVLEGARRVQALALATGRALDDPSFAERLARTGS